MASSKTRPWVAVLFIAFCLSIPFAITYYTSTQGFREKYRAWQLQNQAAGVPSASRVTQQKVVLIKDDRVKVGNTALVYKGIEKGVILVDLYLLELDAGYPYPQKVNGAHKSRAFRMGDISYTLSSVSPRVLTLKIAEMFQTQ